MDNELGKMVMNQNEEFTVLPVRFTVNSYGVAVRKNDIKLLASINKTIGELHYSGEYQRLVDRHINAYLMK